MMHSSTFKYLKPTDLQLETMETVRDKFWKFSMDLDRLLPEGADKTYIMRQLRTIAMWSNVSITRDTDGSPRMGNEIGEKIEN